MVDDIVDGKVKMVQPVGNWIWHGEYPLTVPVYETKPTRWHRFWMRCLLGITWQDV